MNKDQVMTAMNYSIGDNLGITFGEEPSYRIGDNFGTDMSCWNYWQNWYYPTVIRESYPVYIQERAKDKAKQAYEIVKILKDKKLAKLEKVADFIDLMDELIKIL